MNRPQVCIIGWDGADWRILRPLMDAGLLPHLRSLVARGRMGPLLSTLPPVTAPAWTSFLTGVNPGKHGLFTWQGPLNRRFERPFLDAGDVRAPRLWDWLTQAGKRSLFLNVPLTFPPATFNGVLVGGMLTPGTEVQFTHPADVRELLLSDMPDYQVDVEMQHTDKDRTSPRGMRAHLDEVFRATEQRVRAWELLWTHYGPFDLAMIVFEGSDRVQHPLYSYAANVRPDDADAEWDKRRAWVWDYYHRLDEDLGRVLSMCNDNTTIILMSDHGFAPLHQEFCANEWLLEKGWLRFREGPSALYRPLRPLAQRVKRFLPRSLFRRGKESIAGLKAIDWAHTVAYSGGPMEDGIWLNVRGREPAGIVTPEQYEDIREEVMAALRQVRTPDGRPLCRGVYRREEAYSGPYVEQAADIILDLNEGIRFTSLRNPKGGPWRAVEPRGQGTHRKQGIILIAGPGIKPGAFKTAPHIVDLAPTILGRMGIPVPTAFMDGQVLKTVAPSYTAVESEETPVTEIDAVAYTDEESRLIEEHLRSLGYIE